MGNPNRSLFPLLASALLTLLGACSEDAPTQRGAAAGTSCGSANLTQVCTCDGGAVGAQVCDGNAWVACVCTVVDTGTGGTMAGSGGSGGSGGSAGTGGATGAPPVGVADLNIPSGIVFDWDPMVPFPDGTCEPGFYLGVFDGFYASPAAFQFPVPVVGDVNLTLGASTDGENFVVSDGMVSGTANGIFPFSANIVGSLNCATAEFTGTLEDGTYNALGVDYFFSGPITAQYNRVIHAFESGTWEVEEPPLDPANPPLTPAGGTGTWNCTLQP